MKRAIVIGATSGIGKAVAEVLAKHGYMVGLTGRRVELLEQLHKEIPTPTFMKALDVAHTHAAMHQVRDLIGEMGGMDLIVVNAGVRFENQQLDCELEQKTIDVNVSGFVAMANVAAHYFCEQGAGHIVGISSIAALRGRKDAPAYHASKAFVMNYLQGLRHKFSKMGLPIAVTDIRPGLVDTGMTAGRNYLWVTPPETVAKHIYVAIKRRKTWVLVPKRWYLPASFFITLPEWFYNKT